MFSVAKTWLVIVVAGLLLGSIILVWVWLLGPAFTQAEYRNYQDSSAHLQAVAQRFSDDCLQLAQSPDQADRKAPENGESFPYVCGTSFDHHTGNLTV